MKQWMTALGTVVVTMNGLGCAPVVLDPVQPQGSTSSATGGGGGGGGEGEGGGTASGGGVTVIAILAKDLPAPSGGTPDDSSLNGFEGIEPDSLLLLWSNGAEPCSNPAIGETCPTDDTVWQGILVLPPDLVRVGLVDLANPRISTYSYTFTGSGGMCGGGGGGGGPFVGGGSLEIVSTDGGSIAVNLITPIEGSPAFTTNGVTTPSVMLQGPYTASRCEPAPTPPSPSAAVAISGADLPAGLPSSPTIGATPDPTALYVFLGTGTQTCADPLSPLGCMGAARITLKIPAALQQPGTLQLSDPQLATSIEIAADGSGNCTSTVGTTFMEGTMTISSFDASGISFTLYQSLTTSPAGPSVDLDGLYQATLCQ